MPPILLSSELSVPLPLFLVCVCVCVCVCACARARGCGCVCVYVRMRWDTCMNATGWLIMCELDLDVLSATGYVLSALVTSIHSFGFLHKSCH